MRRLLSGAVFAALFACQSPFAHADEPKPREAPTEGDSGAPSVPVQTGAQPDDKKANEAPKAPSQGRVATPDPPAKQEISTPIAPSVRVGLPAWMPDVRIEPGMDVVAAYSFRATLSDTSPIKWYHAFEVPRAIAAVRVFAGPAVGAIAVEGVYSSSEGALVGVAGDSFVVRIREARVGYRLGEVLSVDAGIVPTLVIPTLDAASGLRALGAAAAEQQGILSPADLGLSAKVSFPRKYGFAAVGVYNGEGYTNRELNRGKNIELAVLFRPAPSGIFGPFGLFASYQNGSTGTGLSRADRATGALVWEGDRLRGAAAFTYAMGVADQGSRDAALIDVGIRGEPVSLFILAGRVQAYLRDMRSTDDQILLMTGAVGFRIAPPLEAFLALTRSLPGGAAAVSAPGSDYWEGRSAARFAF